jgi:hypothetical protein
MIITLFILTILLDATGDALTLRNKTFSHIVQAVNVAIWIWLVTHGFKIYSVFDYIYILAAYALIRHGLFDYTWNLVAGQNIFYQGTTSLYDIYIAKTFISIWPARLFAFISGIIMLYKLLHV